MSGAVLGLDLSTRLCGYCAGCGDRAPTAGAWKLPQVAEDIGAMLAAYEAKLQPLIAAYRVELVMIESPIRMQHDDTMRLRKLFSIAGFTEWVCHTLGIECLERPAQTVKKAFTGNANAPKDLMVEMALKLGVTLPKAKSDGREDAADATALWYLALLEHEPKAVEPWDKLLYRARGAML